MKKIVTHLIVLLLSINAFAQNEVVFDSLGIIADGAQLKEVSSQFEFTEGPAVDKKGNIYFTDQPNNSIWKYYTDGRLELFLDKSGRANGLYIDRKGNIIACADENNELWQISPKKKITVLMRSKPGKKYNGPNDLWIDGKGGIYFTDPYYQRPYWQRHKPDLDAQKVYYLPRGAAEPIPVNDDLKKPNGIVGTPDGKYLYVADIGDNKIYRFEMNADGSLSHKQMHAPQGADGITLDSEGNLYLAGRGISVYNASGVKIAHIPVPANWCGNVCFGGRDRKTLFITASKSVFVLNMRVNGVE